MCCLFPIPEPYSCFIPALALSPSKGWTTLLSIPVSFLFLPHHLQKRLDNPSFCSCSCSVAFKRLDNPSFNPSPIPFLPLSPSKSSTPFFSIPFPFLFLPFSIPALALSSSKGSTILLSIPIPFLFLLCRLQKGWTNCYFHSYSIPALALSPSKRLDNPSFHSCPIPILAPVT